MKSILRFVTILMIFINISESNFSQPSVTPITGSFSTTETVKSLGDLPFIENWSSGGFDFNGWTFEPAQANLSVTNTFGNPFPSAMFNWEPVLTNYSYALVSPALNAMSISDNITLKFDIKLNNHSTATHESLAVEVFNGTSWHLIHDYSNVSGSFPFTSESFNITSIAAGHNFNVRFRVHGENSFNINLWNIDNIKIYEQVIGNLAGVITKLSDGAPVDGAILTISSDISGNYTATSGTNGGYIITGSESGSYALAIEKDGFNTIEDSVTIPGNQTLTRNFALTAPVINVSPDALAVTIAAGDITTREIVVANTGSGTLSWRGSINNTCGNVDLYHTDFESFIPGNKVACQDSIHWTTWSNAPCGAEDGIVSTDFASSPVQSVKISDANDLILSMGNKISGKYEFSFDMYIPSGHGGYYSILHYFNSNLSEWGLEFLFEDGGTARLHVAGLIIPYPYNHDQWFHVTNIIDLDNDIAEVLIDGITVFTWQWSLDEVNGTPGMNLLSATNFFSATGAPGILNSLYYIDNVVYKLAEAKKFSGIQAGNNKFPQGAAIHSNERGPADNYKPSTPLSMNGIKGYAFENYPGDTFFSFDPEDPSTQHIISPITIYPHGGTFDAFNRDFMYVIDYIDDHLKKVVISTGFVVDIGLCNPVDFTQEWSGITVDKSTNIMYGISSDSEESYLYTINMISGATTIIGPTGIPGAIDCAIDGTGQIYSFSVVKDAAYKVDKATGASTLLGPIGYDANFSAGMGWEPVFDVIYLAGYNDATETSELRILDRITGHTNLVGSMNGEIDGLAFQGGGVTWASINPLSGTIGPGNSQVVTVTFDGSYIPPEKDITATGNIVFTTIPSAGSPEVSLSMTITGQLFGILEGIVTHGVLPLGGVSVSATRRGSNPYIYNVATDADGVYSFVALPFGTYDITASKPGFNVFTAPEPVIVAADQTTVYDIAMSAPEMVIDPPGIIEYVPFDSIVTRNIVVSNTGDGELDWYAVVGTTKKQKVSVPASDGTFPHGSTPVSIGFAPATISVPARLRKEPKGITGFAFNINPENTFFSFNPEDPAIQNVISSIDYFPSGGTFDAINTSFMYIIDNHLNLLKKVEVETGDVTSIGSCKPYSGQTWTGIAVDKNTNAMYGISTDMSESFLYYINKETGTTDIIGPTGIRGAIDLAIDGTGQMYSFDIVTDESYRIDKETGTSTVLGIIGFDANFAQGMGWDPESDIVYLAAYNNSTGSGELRILDRESGNTTLVGLMNGEIDALGFPGTGGRPWLTIDKTTGILPAGTSDTVTVTLDRTIPPYKPDVRNHGNITFSSEPNVGSVVVPVTMSGNDWHGIMEGYVTHDGIGVRNATITATRSGPVSYTAMTNNTGHYLINNLIPGPYDVRAEATGFNTYHASDVFIYSEDTTILNIVLTSPAMTIDPMDLVLSLPSGETATRWLTITNSGDSVLEVSGSVHLNSKKDFLIPENNAEFPHGTAAPSVGRAPACKSGGKEGFHSLSGSIGYAFDIYPEYDFFSFNTDDPGTHAIISPISYNPAGATFSATNNYFLFVIDNYTNILKKVSVATGAVTDIGIATTYGTQTWTGITIDKTTNIMYGIATDMTESYLYLIDTTMAATTIIGMTGIPGAIDITIDGNGLMYSIDIINNNAYRINKETAAATLLGSLGYDANYAQGMGWDPLSDVVFLAAYNNATESGELRILDRMTGNTTLVGVMGGEIDGLAFSGEGGGATQWMYFGTEPFLIPAGGSVTAPVSFNAAGLEDGIYTGQISFLNNPRTDSIVLPVTLAVGPFGGPTLSIEQLTNIPYGPVWVDVHAENISNMGSFQFTIDYDVSKLTYIDTYNWYPGITDVLVSNPALGKLTFVWAASTAGINITNGNFFTLGFTFNGSMLFANILWSGYPTPREFADWDGNIFVPNYNNGFVIGESPGLPENGPQSIRVYPNPASEEVTVKSDFAIQRIEILSYLGQSVYNEGYHGDKEDRLKVSALPVGIYFVKVNTEQGVRIVKVAVEH